MVSKYLALSLLCKREGEFNIEGFFMKKFLILVSIAFVSSAAFAGGFSDCYAKAYQSLNNVDSVKACAGAGAGFKDCYTKAFQSLNNVDSVNACAGAGSDFSDCYAKAYQSLNNVDSVRACAVRTCN